MSYASDAIAAAKEWLGTFNPGDEIDEESGFTADYLREVIQLAEIANATGASAGDGASPIQPAEVWPVD